MGGRNVVVSNELLLILLIGYMIRRHKMRNSLPAVLAIALIIGVYLQPSW